MAIIKLIKIVLKSFLDFFRDDGLMFAGSISYFFMMALVPFCLFIVTVFGSLFGEHREFYDFFLSKMVSFFPQVTSKITKELENIITYRGLGKPSLIIYGLLSYQLFSSIEKAINSIFKIKVKRSIVISLIRSLLIVTSIIAFFTMSFIATSAIASLKTLQDIFPGLRISRRTGFFLGMIVPLFIVFLTVATQYILLPKRRVRVAHALIGGLFTAVFFEMAKHLFTFFVAKVARLGTIYGPLSAFIIFLLWVFYSSCIFLVGAEIVHNLGSLKKDR